MEEKKHSDEEDVSARVVSWKEAGYECSIDFDSASLWKKTLFSFTDPLLKRAKVSGLKLGDAGPILSPADCIFKLVTAYSNRYDHFSARQQKRRRQRNIFIRTMLFSHSLTMLCHLLWGVAETVFRILSPLFLREFIRWLNAYENSEGNDVKDSEGWTWAGLLCGASLLLTLSHHQFFWWGMRLGFQMKQQAIAAIQEKLLRLNSATFSHLSTGQIVNLVSNDVRRFDDFGPFWLFSILGPLETAVVLVLMAREIGIWPAIVGLSTLILIIPIQGQLAGKIAGLRARTASFTDERVRITGEVIEGAGNVKMLCWEPPFQKLLEQIRAAETKPMRTMLLIEASAMALMFFCTPVACLAAFGTAVALGRVLHLEQVFYIVALLNLPKLWLALFFVKSIKASSETWVAASRIWAFLQQVEAALPADAPSAGLKEGEIRFQGSSFAWGSRAWAGLPDVLPDTAPTALLSPIPKPGKKLLPSAASDSPTTSPTIPASPKPPSQEEEEDKRTAPVTLHAPEFQVEAGAFVGVAGAVGSGKTSLLAALLGELQPVPPSGHVAGSAIERAPLMRGRVAYCQQVPWIEAGSVRDNILFGLPFEPSWYEEVVEGCALRHDIQLLPAGDATEIGERGINLSGGQKARLALARAAYSRPHIALLDDPLSAVDPKVAKTLFSQCIGPSGLLQKATRILVTHQTQWLQACDRVLLLRGGRIAADGTWQTLSATHQFPELKHVASAASLGGPEDSDAPDGSFVSAASPPLSAPPEVLSTPVDTHAPTVSAAEEGVHSNIDTAQVEVTLEPEAGLKQDGDKDAPRDTGKLTHAEIRATGALKGNVWWQYMHAMGLGNVTVLVSAILLGQAAWILSDWWLARWSQATPADQRSHLPKWLGVYGAIVASVVVLSTFRNLGWFATALSASSRLNAGMLASVLGAKLSFFHTTPSGRILNVFSKDQGSIDEQLPQVLFDSMQTITVTLGGVVLIAIANPPIIPLFIPLAYVFIRVRQYYVHTSREVKRLEAVTRSPVYAMFSATIKGLPTIRAFRAAPRFRSSFLQALDLNGSWWLAYICTARWVGARMDVIAFVLFAVSTLVAMAAKSLISASLLALALTHLLQLSGSMQWAVRQTAEAENHMTSVERVLQYSSLPPERSLPPSTSPPPPGWPSDASLEFDNVVARYRPGLPPVLKGVSFSIPSGSSCGVVGRTGSGKSSLLLALFDLIDVTSGRILLSGTPTASLPLQTLRQQIAIIPQDPLLFSGSLRNNLDPWDAKEDADVWGVLEAVQLKERVHALGGLQTTMAEAGSNFSAGQRQLLCLARALLSSARLLSLDEATANVDRQTDSIIQQALRAAVKGGAGGVQRTMLVIAHRVDTIYDCDHLLVLSDGRLVESGRPATLAEGSGTFAELVRAARANEMELRL